MSMNQMVNFGNLTFSSSGQSIFASNSFGGFTAEIGGTFEQNVNIDFDLLGLYFDADVDIEVGARAVFDVSGGEINSEFQYSVGADLFGGLNAVDGELIQYITGTEELFRSKFDTKAIGLTAYLDLLYYIAGEIGAGFRDKAFFDTIKFDSTDLPLATTPDTYGEDDKGELGQYRLIQATPSGLSLFQNPFDQFYDGDVLDSTSATPFMFSADGLAAELVVKGNFISPAIKVSVGDTALQNFPADQLKEPSIDLAAIKYSIPNTAPSAQGIQGDGILVGNTISGSDAKPIVRATVDIDGALTYTLWHGGRIPLPFEFGIGDFGKFVLADIDAGVEMRLREDLELTADGLGVTLDFWNEDQSERITVEIEDENGDLIEIETWTGKWSDVPAFKVSQTTIVQPVYDTGASLSNQTGIELGVVFEAVIAKLGYKVGPFTGAFGPLAKVTLTEDDLFGLAADLGVPDLSDFGFFPLFNTDNSGPVELGGFSSNTFGEARLDAFLINFDDPESDGFDPGKSGIISTRNSYAPTAVDDVVHVEDEAGERVRFQVSERSSGSFDASILLRNDYDLDAYDTIKIRSVSSDVEGLNVQLNRNGEIVVTVDDLLDLDRDATRDVTFSYVIQDERRHFTEGQATIEVLGINVPPSPQNDKFTVFIDFDDELLGPYEDRYPGNLLLNDFDEDDSFDNLSVVLDTFFTSNRGFVFLNEDGTFGYGASDEYFEERDSIGTLVNRNLELLAYNGSALVEQFAYSVRDGSGDTASAIAELVVIPYVSRYSDIGDNTVLIRSGRADGEPFEGSERRIIIEDNVDTEAYVVLIEAPEPGRDVIVTLEQKAGVAINGVSGADVQLTFTSENWTVPQIVDLSGVPGVRTDDDVDDILNYSYQTVGETAVTQSEVPIRLIDKTVLSLVGPGFDRRSDGEFSGSDGTYFMSTEANQRLDLRVNLSDQMDREPGSYLGETTVYLDVEVEEPDGNIVFVANLGDLTATAWTDENAAFRLTRPLELFLNNITDGLPRSAKITISVNEELTTDPFYADVDPITLSLEIFTDNPFVAPILVDDEITTLEDQSITFDPRDNDIQTQRDGNNSGTFMTLWDAEMKGFPDGDGFTAPNGTVSLDRAAQTLTYTPNANFSGWDFISYTLAYSSSLDADGNLVFETTEAGEIAVFVEAVNDLPFTTVAAPVLVAFEDQPVDIELTQLVRDLDGDEITFGITGFSMGDLPDVVDENGNILSGPAIVELVDSELGPDTILRFTGPANFSNLVPDLMEDGTQATDADGTPLYVLGDGLDPLVVTYSFSDDGGATVQTQDIQILLTPVNDGPTTQSDTFTVSADGDLANIADDLVANDSDLEGDAFSVVALQYVGTDFGTFYTAAELFPGTAASALPRGSVTIAEDGTISYAPSEAYALLAAGETITEEWQYLVRDAGGALNIGTVNFDIVGVDDPTIGVGDTFRVEVFYNETDGFWDQSAFFFSSVVANDIDPDFASALRQDSTAFTSSLGARVEIADTLDGEFLYAVQLLDGFRQPTVPAFDIAPGEVVIDTFTYEAYQDATDAYYTAEVAMVVTGAGGAPASGFVVSRDALSVQEQGEDGSVWVALTSAPDSDVVITLDVSNPEEVDLQTTELVFTAENWASAQQVFVTAVDDKIVDGDQTSTLTIAVDEARSDAAYEANPQVVDITTLDRAASADLLVTKQIVVVEEGGDTDSFRVSLAQAPTSNVLVKVGFDSFGVATVSGATVIPGLANPSVGYLTFTPENWSTAQTVTLTAVDDSTVDGFETSQIMVEVVADSSAAEFADAASHEVMAGIIDNDAPPPPPTVSITAVSGSKFELNTGTNFFAFEVTRSGSGLDEPLTMAYRVEVPETGGASAADFSTLTLPSGTVTFEAGETTARILVPVAGDNVLEVDEAFSVVLAPRTDVILAEGAGSAQAIILNDDTPPEAEDDSITIFEDTATQINVLENDTDPDGETFIILSATQGGFGQVTLAANRQSLTYTPDFEASGTDTFTYTITDGVRTDTATVTVVVEDVQDAPVATDVVFDTPFPSIEAFFGIFGSETLPLSLLATDDDNVLTVDSLTYLGATVNGTAVASIGDLGLFLSGDFVSFDPQSSALFADLELGQRSNVVVTFSVTDGEFTDEGTISFTVIGATDSPEIVSDTRFYVGDGDSVVAQIEVEDDDTALEDLTFTLADSGDGDLFEIDGNGNLRFVSPPEITTPLDTGGTAGDNVYVVDVEVTDETGNTDSQSVEVVVNRAPVITSADAFTVPDDTLFIAQIEFEDDVYGFGEEEFIFDIGFSFDANFFTIGRTSGVLEFSFPVDFDTPADFGGIAPFDNIYEVVVEVRDSGGLTASQTIEVTVVEPNAGPTITSVAEVSVVENTTAVTQVTATDPEDDTLTFSLSGTDADLFEIDTSGNVSFKAAPDFEAPVDAGGDNIYDVDVTVSDGDLSDVQSLVITVTDDVTEPEPLNPITGTAGNDRLFGTAGADRINPEAGALDMIFGGAGGDVFDFSVKAVNGVKEQTFIYDFDAEQGDLLDLGTSEVAIAAGIGGNTYINLHGDGDQIVLFGVAAFGTDYLA